MLDSWCSIIVHVLLNLALSLAGSWLVDGHLDGLVPIGDHDGLEGTVLGVHLIEIKPCSFGASRMNVSVPLYPCQHTLPLPYHWYVKWLN